MIGTTEPFTAITEETEQLTSVIEELLQFGKGKLPMLIAGLVVLVLGLVISELLSKAMQKMLHRSNADPTAAGFVQSFIRVALYLLVGVIVLSVLQVPMASIITVLGTMGLAIVLALKDNLSNVAGGILLLFTRPLKVGDFVEIDGTTGTVVQIAILQTKMRCLDGTSVFIPNSRISGGVVKNYSEDPQRRVDLDFGISYQADAEKAKDLITAVVLKSPYALKAPAPIIRIGGLSDSAVILHVRVWTTHEHYWDLYYDLYEQIKAAFDQNGVEIPFPQMDVHMK